MLKRLAEWAWRSWPVSAPTLLVAAVVWFCPTLEYRLRYSGLSLEATALFIIGLRLSLVRRQFKAPSWFAVAREWAVQIREVFRPKFVDGSASFTVGGVELKGRGRVEGWPQEPVADADVVERVAFLTKAAAELRRRVNEVENGLHKRLDEGAKETDKRLQELQRDLTSQTGKLNDDLKDLGVGNVQREQWAVFLLFTGAVLMTLAGEVAKW